MRRGYFISFEGIDGSGKTAMANMLAEYLRARGHEVVLTREPGGSMLGCELRRLLLNDQRLLLDARDEALLFAADRAAHVRETIFPALRAGSVVLCDRYTDSTLAYQGGGRGLPEDFLRRLNDFASGGLRPALTYFLDVPLAVARQRHGLAQDRMEQEDEGFFVRVAAVYRRLAAEEPLRMRTLDAARPPQEVFSSILECLPLDLSGERPHD